MLVGWSSFSCGIAKILSLFIILSKAHFSSIEYAFSHVTSSHRVFYMSDFQRLKEISCRFLPHFQEGTLPFLVWLQLPTFATWLSKWFRTTFNVYFRISLTNTLILYISCKSINQHDLKFLTNLLMKI